jgi:hypothetical protein
VIPDFVTYRYFDLTNGHRLHTWGEHKWAVSNNYGSIDDITTEQAHELLIKYGIRKETPMSDKPSEQPTIKPSTSSPAAPVVSAPPVKPEHLNHYDLHPNTQAVYHLPPRVQAALAMVGPLIQQDPKLRARPADLACNAFALGDAMIAHHNATYMQYDRDQHR